MNKILIISSSPRVGGNSDILCDYFAQGAQSVGAEVKKINLNDKKLGFCHACYACHKTGQCFQKDDAAQIIKEMFDYDFIVFATPVYFYTMSAQLKTLIDRSVSIYPTLTGKKYFYIMTMAETDREMITGTLEALRGFLACYENSIEAGWLLADGVYEKGSVKDTKFCQEAFEQGKLAATFNCK